MTESLRTLLGSLIDYAGLFPPAALSMEPTVKNYDAYRRGANAWLLARLVMPVARLSEFESAAARLPPAGEEPRAWRLTSPLGPDVGADCDKIMEFNARHAPSPGKDSCMVESVEIRAANAKEIRAAASHVLHPLRPYYEIPLSGDLEGSLTAIGDVGGRAKVRTGGESPEMFPSSADLVRFFELCAGQGVAFKASAGLHRPVRGLQRYTYKPDSASSIMHGFLNVFLAASFVFEGMSQQDAAELLDEQSPAAFDWEEKGIAWREEYIGNEQLALARKVFCLTVGSCSFAEPVDNLKALALI